MPGCELPPGAGMEFGARRPNRSNPSGWQRTAVTSAWQAEPSFHHGFNFTHLRRGKCSESAQEFRGGHGQHALDVERTCFEKTDGKPNLKLSAPGLRGM